MDVGKPISEADAEVSEAMDFLNYYAKCAYYFAQKLDLSFIAKGISLVTMPWKFSCAIKGATRIKELFEYYDQHRDVFKEAPFKLAQAVSLEYLKLSSELNRLYVNAYYISNN